MDHPHPRLRPWNLLTVIWRWKGSDGEWIPTVSETKPHVPILFERSVEATKFAEEWAAEGRVDARVIPIKLEFDYSKMEN